jgi:hypothetical protein
MERLAFTAWLAASAGACTGWQVETVSPEQAISQKHPDEIRVTLSNSSRVKLQQPALEGDTLVGLVGGHATTTGAASTGAFGENATLVEVQGGTQLRLPVSDAKYIETHHVSTGKTLGVVAGVALVAVVAWGIAVAISFSESGL